MYQKLILLFLICFSTTLARVPSRTHETEETPAVVADKSKDEAPIESNPVERTPVTDNDDESSILSNRPKKPIGVILFRTQPRISLFRDRSPFDSPAFHPLGHPHFAFGNPGSFRDDPALRLLSILFGDRLRPMQPESDFEAVNGSASESSAESSELDRRGEHPFESLFPNIFVPRFPIDSEKEGEATTNNEDKTAPTNFENKEKKVINLGGRKFVKTTQTKKVKNDFGEFHSVISSYQPFDEKIHDENGNEKINPEESNNERKDVESTTSSSKPEISSTSSSSELVPSSTSTQVSVEKEEESKVSELDIKPEDKKLSSESLSKDKIDESKNEIPDKAEIKVDQMN